MTLASETDIGRARALLALAGCALAAVLSYSPGLLAQTDSEQPPPEEPSRAFEAEDGAVPSPSEASAPDIPAPEAPEDPHIRAAARSLATQGAAAFEQGQFDVALDYFQRAGVLVQAPTILVMEARTLAQLGRLIEALDKYETAQRFQLPATASDAFKQAVHAAGQEVEALRGRIPQLNITIEGQQPEKPAEVWLDERKVLDVLIGVDQPLDPGSHLIEVRGSGFDPIFRQVDLPEGVKKKVSIELPLSQEAAPVSMPPPRKAVLDSLPKESNGLTRRTLAWVALGVGAGASVAGSITGLIALTKKAELDEVCTPGCPQAYANEISTFRTQRTLSYLSFGLGLVAGGTGGYLLLTDRAREPEVAVGLSPSGAALRGAF